MLINLKSKDLNHEIHMTIAFQNGEEIGFDFFYRQLFPSLCYFANRKLNNMAEAEDVVSGAFIKIWKRHEKFSNAENIRSYLYQIVRNDCLKFHEKRKRFAVIKNQIEYLSTVDLENNIEADIIRSEFFGELYKALKNLPPQCRKVFSMLYIEGKGISEVAKELNLSPNTIKTQRARGLAMFRKKFVSIVFVFSFIFS